MTIIPLFPTNIHHVAVDNYSDIKADLIGFVDAQKVADPKGITKSNTGWHSQLSDSGIVLNINPISKGIGILIGLPDSVGKK